MLQDWLLISLSDCDLLKIKYHARYSRSGERNTQMQNSSTREATAECLLASPTSREKAAKTGANPSPKERPCIICYQIKYQDDTKKFRICEEYAAKTLRKTAAFNRDSVYTRCILFKRVGDVYTADAMYHNNCFNRHIREFQHDGSHGF